MLEKINLLPKVEAIWGKQAKIRRWAQVGSTILLVGYFFILSSIFSYFLLLKQKAASVQAQINETEQQVRLLQGRESKQLLLKEKLKELTEILKSGQDSTAALREVQGLALEGIAFTSLSYLGNELRLEGEAVNALVFDELVKSLANVTENRFSQVLFESINKMEDGDYQFQILIKR